MQQTITEKHESTKDIFELMIKNNIVASYIGPFDSEVLTMLGENVETSLWKDKYKGRKFFKIFIELAQNISLYSATSSSGIKEKDFGQGTLLINEFENHFMFSAGNIVEKEKINFLANKCKLINSLDRDGLRELRRKLRKQTHEQGGGNIGLVQVALISRYPLAYQFVPFEKGNKFFYIIGVKIDK